MASSACKPAAQTSLDSLLNQDVDGILSTSKMAAAASHELFFTHRPLFLFWCFIKEPSR